MESEEDLDGLLHVAALDDEQVGAVEDVADCGRCAGDNAVGHLNARQRVEADLRAF